MHYVPKCTSLVGSSTINSNSVLFLWLKVYFLHCVSFSSWTYLRYSSLLFLQVRICSDDGEPVKTIKKNSSKRRSESVFNSVFLLLSKERQNSFSKKRSNSSIKKKHVDNFCLIYLVKSFPGIDVFKTCHTLHCLVQFSFQN